MFLGALRQVGVAGGDLLGGRADRLRAMAHAAHGIRQRSLHAGETFQQAPHLIAPIDAHGLRQVAGGNAIELRQCGIQRPDDGAQQQPRTPDRHHQREHDGRDHKVADARVGLLRIVEIGLGERQLLLAERLAGVVGLAEGLGDALVHDGVGRGAIARAQRLDDVAQAAGRRFALGADLLGQPRFFVAVRQRQVLLPGCVGAGDQLLGAVEQLHRVLVVRIQHRLVQRRAGAGQAQVGLAQREGGRELVAVGLLVRPVRIAQAEQPGHADQQGQQEQNGNRENQSGAYRQASGHSVRERRAPPALSRATTIVAAGRLHGVYRLPALKLEHQVVRGALC